MFKQFENKISLCLINFMNTFDTLLIIKPKNMSVPQNLISLKEFNEMRDEFNQSIKTKLGTQETDSVWWTFDNLKDYFDYIEKEATQNNISISGIRFHMTAKTRESKQLTVALIPTYEKNAEHIDFDPVLSEKNKPIDLKNLESSISKGEELGAILNRGVTLP